MHHGFCSIYTVHNALNKLQPRVGALDARRPGKLRSLQPVHPGVARAEGRALLDTVELGDICLDEADEPGVWDDALGHDGYGGHGEHRDIGAIRLEQDEYVRGAHSAPRDSNQQRVRRIEREIGRERDALGATAMYTGSTRACQRTHAYRWGSIRLAAGRRSPP